MLRNFLSQHWYLVSMVRNPGSEIITGTSLNLEYGKSHCRFLRHISFFIELQFYVNIHWVINFHNCAQFLFSIQIHYSGIVAVTFYWGLHFDILPVLLFIISNYDFYHSVGSYIFVFGDHPSDGFHYSLLTTSCLIT